MFKAWMRTSNAERTSSRPFGCWDETIEVDTRGGGGCEESAGARAGWAVTKFSEVASANETVGPTDFQDGPLLYAAARCFQGQMKAGGISAAQEHVRETKENRLCFVGRACTLSSKRTSVRNDALLPGPNEAH